jgi:3-oxoacyl-ACP reductase-like protein
MAMVRMGQRYLAADAEAATPAAAASAAAAAATAPPRPQREFMRCFWGVHMEFDNS